MCEKNGSPEGWVYGNKPTYADFSIYNTLDYLVKGDPKFTENFPAAKKLRASVEALPNIAEWLKNRPVTEY